MTSFQLCANIGLILAVLLGTYLAFALSLLPWVMVFIVFVALATLLSTMHLSYVFTGSSQLVFYRHQLAVVTAVAISVHLLDQPVLPYLDVLVISVAAMQMVGRIGCMMAGCCHGKPYPIGLCYPERYQQHIPRYLTNVTLFPVQPLEAFCLALLVISGSFVALLGGVQGAAFVWVMFGYGLVRFLLEYARGSVGSIYIIGLTEAQWTAFFIACGITILGTLSIVPFSPWQWGAAAILLLLLFTKYTPTLLQPRHLRELGLALLQPQMGIHTTSLGIHISYSRTDAATVYTLSSLLGALTPTEAQRLAQFISRIKHGGRAYGLLLRPNVVHFVIAND